MTVQIFVYKFFFAIVFFGEKNNTHEIFHILKMKAHLKKHILEIKAYSETNFENENMFLEK